LGVLRETSITPPALAADEAVTVRSPDGAVTKLSRPPPTSCWVPLPPAWRSTTSLSVPAAALVMFTPS
jgi:hypothetical protein